MSCTQLLVLLFSGAQADPGFQCTVSSLQKNCQAADFVRCDCVFTCPGTLLIRCLVCAVTRVRPLQVAVRLCPSLCGTAERTAGQHLHLKPRVSRSKRESSLAKLVPPRSTSCCTVLKMLFFLLCVFYVFFGEKYYKPMVLSRVRLFVTPWTVACQAPLPMEFPRREYWSGLLFPIPWDLPNPNQTSTCCVSCTGRQILYHQSHLGSP